MKEYELIKRYLERGDPDAARTLLEPFEKPLFQYLWQMLRHQQDSEDALQDTIRKALEALPRYREENHFKSWLFRIGHNTALDQLRQRKKIVPIEDDGSAPIQIPLCPDPDPGVSLLTKERHRELMAAVATLSETERETVYLRFKEDLSFKEIAAVANVPIGTVLARMSRAKAHLKTKLKTL